MTTQFKGTASVPAGVFVDMTGLVSGTASVDLQITVQGTIPLLLIDTSSGSLPTPGAAANPIPPGVPTYVNAAHLYGQGLGGTAIVSFQQIS